jgi:hypothetical protein
MHTLQKLSPSTNHRAIFRADIRIVLSWTAIEVTTVRKIGPLTYVGPPCHICHQCLAAPRHPDSLPSTAQRGRWNTDPPAHSSKHHVSRNDAPKRESDTKSVAIIWLQRPKSLVSSEYQGRRREICGNDTFNMVTMHADSAIVCSDHVGSRLSPVDRLTSNQCNPTIGAGPQERDPSPLYYVFHRYAQGEATMSPATPRQNHPCRYARWERHIQAGRRPTWTILGEGTTWCPIRVCSDQASPGIALWRHREGGGVCRRIRVPSW